jgi:hypothetical protein
VVQLIHLSSANTARERLPHAAKAGTKYAEGKVRSGDILDSDGSKYSPNSEVSDEEDKKPMEPLCYPILPTRNQVQGNIQYQSLKNVIQGRK